MSNCWSICQRLHLSSILLLYKIFAQRQSGSAYAKARVSDPH
jgi:hypothetical protein